MRPVAEALESDLVLAARAPGGVGSTIRCVDRVELAVPVRAGFRPAAPGRGTAIGCVVADPTGEIPGINPVGCGGFTAGMEAKGGGG